MKNSSIDQHVYNVNLYYTRLQNKTKELFFKCLDEGRNEDYFKAKLEEIWGNADMEYLEEQIIEYRAYIHKKNTNEKLDTKNITIVGLATLGAVLLANKMFKKVKTKEYSTRLNSYAYKVDKDEYLKKLVPKYTDNTKRYKDNRFVSPSTYNSMVYNTALTRNSWVQTINDAKDLGYRQFIIKYHPFSCDHCMSHQNRVMSAEECIDTLGIADETEGDILHPNCKCELTIVKDFKDIRKDKYNYLSYDEKLELSDIRQKINGLTLEKERLLTDKKIYKEQGNQDMVDKTNEKISKINNSIKELQDDIPNAELQKQVVAIYR